MTHQPELPEAQQAASFWRINVPKPNGGKPSFEVDTSRVGYDQFADLLGGRELQQLFSVTDSAFQKRWLTLHLHLERLKDLPGGQGEYRARGAIGLLAAIVAPVEPQFDHAVLGRIPTEAQRLLFRVTPNDEHHYDMQGLIQPVVISEWLGNQTVMSHVAAEAHLAMTKVGNMLEPSRPPSRFVRPQALGPQPVVTIKAGEEFGVVTRTEHHHVLMTPEGDLPLTEGGAMEVKSRWPLGDDRGLALTAISGLIALTQRKPDQIAA